MARVAAVLPGYATVRQSSGVLHLAPRSVRDLIYAGRLPSVRIGRVHFVRAADLELERRRRLGLRLPTRTQRQPRRPASQPRQAHPRSHVDPARRRERAAERAALVSQWTQRHPATPPDVPFAAALAEAPTACEICGRGLRAGARIVLSVQERSTLCMACGRRVLLDWADHRRLEAAAARRMAQALGSAPARLAALAPPRTAARDDAGSPELGAA